MSTPSPYESIRASLDYLEAINAGFGLEQRDIDWLLELARKGVDVASAAKAVEEAKRELFVARCVHDGPSPEITEAYRRVERAEELLTAALAAYESLAETTNQTGAPA